MRGGATLILDAWGRIQYIVRKGIASADREKQVVDYMTGAGAQYWTGTRKLALVGDLFRGFCVRRDAVNPAGAARGDAAGWISADRLGRRRKRRACGAAIDGEASAGSATPGGGNEGTAPIPLPASLPLMIFALGGLGLFARCRGQA